MIIHIIVGKENSKSITEHINRHELKNESVFVLKDELHVGPLKTHELSFSEGRTEFWNNIYSDQKVDRTINDLENLMKLSSDLTNGADDQLWFWMNYNAENVCAYYWLLHFLKKHQGKLFVINIAGLPFINESGSLFYAENFAMLPDKEIFKAKKLVRVISPSEWETDGDEWKRILSENALLRIANNSKIIESKSLYLYDNTLLNLLQKTGNRPAKILQQVQLDHKIQVGKPFLQWRLRELTIQQEE